MCIHMFVRCIRHSFLSYIVILIATPRLYAHSIPTFVNGDEEVKSLPPNVQQMFTLLTEEEFRLDISSTELRVQLNG